jgi:hypothetical protein
MSDGHRERAGTEAQRVVATLDVNARRVAVRSIAWLGQDGSASKIDECGSVLIELSCCEGLP